MAGCKGQKFQNFVSGYSMKVDMYLECSLYIQQWINLGNSLKGSLLGIGNEKPMKKKLLRSSNLRKTNILLSVWEEKVWS